MVNTTPWHQDTTSIQGVRHLSKFNHQPIRLIPVISKIFKKVFYEEIGSLASKILSSKLGGFRKGHSLQGLLTLTKDGKNVLVNML